MKGARDPALAVLLTVCLILPGFGGALASRAPQLESAPSYPNSSWAIGVVVPEGARTLDGGNVLWGNIANVTATIALPNISSPDQIVYAILSVMTNDGSVLQAAAGALPNRTGWLVSAWLIQGIGSGTLSYQWVLNGSTPQMSPLANISISIFRVSGLWSLRVFDMDSGSSVEKQFPSGPAPSLRVGDQEVFALESYSRTLATFLGMGSLRLYSILLDGKKVTSGSYLYYGWDMIHNPLFVVGSSGTSPPSFINAEEGSAGSFYWNYTEIWAPQVNPIGGLAEVLTAVSVAGALTLGGVGVWLAKKKPDL